MKQYHQNSKLSGTTDNESTAAEKASASEVWFFWAMVARWGGIGFAVLYWVGVVGFSPLHFVEWVGGWSGYIQSSAQNLAGFPGGLIWFIHELITGLSWVALTFPWLAYVRYRVGVIEAGSKMAYHKRLKEDAVRASKPAPVGLLVGVSIAKGGFFSSSETLVETSEGFYRVSRLVNTVKKGEPVFTQGGQLLIGTGNNQKRYTVIS